MKTRVAVIHEIVSPYRAPLFAALSSQHDLDVTVVLSAEGEARRSWEVDLARLPYPWKMVASRAIVLGRVEKSTWIVPWGMSQVLDCLRPDVVVLGGYANLPSLAAQLWASRRRVPVVMWSESIWPGRGGPVKIAKRTLVRQAHAYVVPGQLAAGHLENLGAHRDRIFVSPNCVDLDLFRPAFRLDRQPVLLACGQLVPRKGWSLVGPALQEADPDRRVRLLIVGEGPDRGWLEADLAARGVPATFTGHVQYHELPTLFTTASAILFPSLGDVWGFSLQEAMACGLPAVASTRAGAAMELVEDGVNGWLVEPEVAEVARALRKLFALDAHEWAAMSAAARTSAEHLSVGRAVVGFRRALGAARGQ